MYSYSINSLLVFYAVVKTKSFSKAARMLHMTQPGVSNHVTQLETQTGNRLLIREKGGFKLTKEGKMIFKYAERLEAVATELENAIKYIKKESKPLIRIATTPVYSKIMMPFILDSFQKANPEIMIKLDLGGSEDMMETLYGFKNDVVIAANQKVSHKTYTYPLLKEELVLITSKKHPLSKKSPVSLKEIAPYPLVMREEGSSTRRVVLEAFDALGIKPAVLIDVKSTEFIKEWVSQGKGVSILIRRAVTEDEKKYLVVIQLKEPLYLEVSLHYLKSRKYDLSIQKFVEHVKELKANAFLQ